MRRVLLVESFLVWTHRLSNINTEKKTADCAHCGPVKIVHRQNGKPGGRTWKCQQAVYLRRVAHQYKVSVEEVLTLHREQGGICALCKDEMPTPHVDHDHTTGAVRGLLCRDCNLGLGYFKDNPARLRLAIRYLTP